MFHPGGSFRLHCLRGELSCLLFRRVNNVMATFQTMTPISGMSYHSAVNTRPHLYGSYGKVGYCAHSTRAMETGAFLICST